MRHVTTLCFCCILCTTLLNAESYIIKSSSSQPQVFVEATRKARQSVVSILVSFTRSSERWITLKEEGLSQVSDDEPVTKSKGFGGGSGFIISKDGYIVTNNHVVANADTIFVQTFNGEEYPATLIERDPTTDVALLKIDGKNLPAIAFADSSKVEVGEWVIAIGTPLGLQSSVSTGIISGENRSYQGNLLIQDFFQIDAAINPGNSGGPLLNLDGKVIGMSTAGLSSHEGNIGINFAIPSNLIKNVLNDLFEHKRPVRGFLDMLLLPIEPSDNSSDFGFTQMQGAYVLAVGPKGPAALAGLRPKDVITKIQDIPIKEEIQARSLIALSKPGDELSFLVVRDSKKIKLTATVGEKPSPSEQELKIKKDLRICVQPVSINPEEIGFLITEIDTTGPAYKAGLRLGQIILETNGKKASSIDEFADEVFRKTFLSLTIFRIMENDEIRNIYLFQ